MITSTRRTTATMVEIASKCKRRCYFGILLFKFVRIHHGGADYTSIGPAFWIGSWSVLW